LPKPNECLFDVWSQKGRWWKAGIEITEDDLIKIPAGELSYDGILGKQSLSLIAPSSQIVLRTGNHPMVDFLNQRIGSDQISQDADPFFWVHGVTSSGEELTLVDAYQTHERVSGSPIGAETSYGFRFALRGGHLEPNDLYPSMGLKFPGLELFLRSSKELDTSFDDCIAVTGRKAESLFESIVDFKDVSTSVQFKSGSSFQSDGQMTRFDVRAEGIIVVRPCTPQPLEWYFQCARSVQSLLCILYGFPTEPTMIDLGIEHNREVNLWYAAPRAHVSRRPEWTHLLVGYSREAVEHQDWIVTVLKNWFALDDEWRSLIDTFLGTQSFPHPTSSVDFLYCSQILEVMHVLQTSAIEVLTESEKAEFIELKKHAKETLTAALLSKVQQCLQFVGKPSQYNRLKDILLKIDAYSPSLLYEDPSDFARCVVDTRNYYVHGIKSHSTFLDAAERYAAVQLLKLAILIFVASKIGIPPEALRLQFNPTVGNWRRHSYLLAPEILRAKTRAKQKD
jgi:hypothetical protein